ncbi:MAG: class I SAM-dependent methyltransferase [Actinomycetes bacterium]
MQIQNKVLLSVAVATPVLLVGAAVLAAGGTGLCALLAAGATASFAGLQAFILLEIRGSSRAVARALRTQSPRSNSARPAAAATWLEGMPIPPPALRFMGEDDAKFVDTARELTRQLSGAGMSDTATVLDIGSGYGRLAAGLLSESGFRGNYIGLDILPKHVAWCKQIITKHDNRFQFVHLDVLNERYNPSGTIPAGEIRFPVPDASIDTCSLFSVFTHMYRDAIEHYLEEIARALRHGGIAVTTWFLFDEDRLAAVTSEKAHYQLTHVLEDGARCMNLAEPLHVIGYEQSDLTRMAARAGLDVERVSRGQWAGDQWESPESNFQDLVVFRKP